MRKLILTMNRENKNHEDMIKTKKGQDKKGVGRMPWHWEPKKDVANYEKLRGDVSSQRYADIRMRELT